MKTVTTIPTAYSSIDEETRQKVRENIYDFIWKIASNAEGLKKAKQKENKLYDELKTLIPKDKLPILKF